MPQPSSAALEREIPIAPKPSSAHDPSHAEPVIPPRLAPVTRPAAVPSAPVVAQADAVGETPRLAPTLREAAERPMPDSPRSVAARQEAPIAPTQPAVPKRSDIAPSSAPAPRVSSSPAPSPSIAPVLRVEPARILAPGPALRPHSPVTATVPGPRSAPGLGRGAERLNLSGESSGHGGAARIGIELPSGEGGPDQASSDRFGVELQKLCARYGQYPVKARNRGIAGTVFVKIEISPAAKSGIKSATVETSSGHGLLDDEAVAACQRIPRIPRPPKGLENREFTVLVPIVFELTDPKKK